MKRRFVYTYSAVLAPPPPAAYVIDLSAGVNFSFALKSDNSIWSWGVATYGQLGNNNTSNAPTPVMACVANISYISSGGYFQLALDNAGKIWSWGYNVFGQLGNNSTISTSTPISIAGAVKTFCKISAGSSHSMAIDNNGKIWGWGYNQYGQLGVNSLVAKSTPVSLYGTKTFCNVTAGNKHSIAVDYTGNTWGWGSFDNLGINNTTAPNISTPILIWNFIAVKTFCKLSVGANHSVGLTNGGIVWIWGTNTNGELGDNTVTAKSTPILVGGATKTFCKIETSASHTLGIDKNGKVWGWGFNTSGQIGDRTIVNKSTPVALGGANKTFCVIAASTVFSAAIDKNGKVWSWGNNANGQLGNNSITAYSTPVSLLGAAKTFCKLVAGVTKFAIGLDKNGRAWGWGYNNVGQLGDITVVSKRTPISVRGAVKTFCEVTAGNLHVVAIDKYGIVWTWGSNSAGQLGINAGVTTNKCTPLSLAGAIKTFCVVAANGTQSFGIDNIGRLWGWGNNTNGQLGDNSTTSRLTPVSVGGVAKTFCQVKAGGSHTIAIDNNKKVWAWGSDSAGQLGFPLNVLTPIQINI